MIFEVCANSYSSAMHAQEGGADRIELCSELGVGGVTPSYGLLKKVMKDLRIPVRVLIRPRSGNFSYSAAEFEVMKADINLAKTLGCEGVVAGVLFEDHRLDFVRTKELIDLAKPMKFTFHRAFDWVENPQEVLRQLIALHIDAILTSGRAANAETGLTVIKELLALAQGKLTILAGGGIHAQNVDLFIEAGCQAIHASASTSSIVGEKAAFPMNNFGQDDRIQQGTTVEKVKAIKSKLLGATHQYRPFK